MCVLTGCRSGMVENHVNEIGTIVIYPIKHNEYGRWRGDDRSTIGSDRCLQFALGTSIKDVYD